MRIEIAHLRSLLKVFNHLEEFLSPSFIERLSGGTGTPLILWLYFGANFHHILSFIRYV